MDADEFGLRLVIAEEQRRQQVVHDVRERPQEREDERGEPTRSVVYEETGVDSGGAFYMTPDDYGVAVPGPGSIDTVLIVADNDQFGVTVDTESTTFVDHRYSTLETNSAELSHAAAYERQDGKFVVSVSDVPYREKATVRVTPSESITFDRLRAVYTIGRESDY